MTIADKEARAAGLDTLSSFCVTAPAGSGKTELLIQRFLGLLGRVERPEQVLAITFTRKAAAEMRERVMAALEDAQLGRPCTDDHLLTTRRLAEAALTLSASRDWHLLRDASRLNIRTIDGFCSGLTRQMPILSQFGGQARAVDKAEELYSEAVTELFELLDSSHPIVADLSQLLLYFDNNWDRLRALLVKMLARRDQWHGYLGSHHSPAESEERLLQTVEQVVAAHLAELAPVLDPWQDEIFDLLCYALQNKGNAPPAAFPAPMANDTELWRALRGLFLTNSGDWRKTVTVRDGFPAGKGEPTERKEHLKRLIGLLSAEAGLKEQLQGLAWLPDMSGNSRSWQTVLLLSHILPILSACLLLVFQRRSVVDHSQVALSALQALGEDDAPTELALRLDYNIEHILVDEFQDTAINQYRLVTRLTRGWGDYNALNPQHPRTIFIVGDGMQSIYGFRDANVGLFLKARQEGFNGVLPHSLELSCNFRSERGIVDWVNATFARAFPAQDNVSRGQVSFTPATPVKEVGYNPAVSCHIFHGDCAAQQEATSMVDMISQALAETATASVAILARSRPQLAPMLQCLQARGIPYAAHDMDKLSGSPAIVDLMSLCRALANPADRVAWFAVFRAPWCGLNLADLHVIGAAGEKSRRVNLWQLMGNPASLPGLSADGMRRLKHVAACMRRARSNTDRLALRVWIEQVWVELGGPATLSQTSRLRDAQRFFELLQEAEQEGVGLDIDWLEVRLDSLYAAGDSPDARVQVMTLHKAKGLEFDWVFIPALAKTTRGQGRDLLLWDEYSNPGQAPGFLLAADDHADDKEPTLYNFLKRQRKEKSALETTRLLYVGATRAIGRLVLSACLDRQESDNEELSAADYKDPPEGSLLAQVWPVFRHEMQCHPDTAAVHQDSVYETPGLLQRLHNVPETVPPVDTPLSADPNIPERATNRAERLIGTVVHLALEELSGQTPLPRKSDSVQQQRWRQALRSLGLAGAALEQAQQRVLEAVDHTLEDDAAGRWLLDSSHEQARSEWPLTRVNAAGDVVDIIIDRCFTDTKTGIRWVVDYKTSKPLPDEGVERFAAREAESYRQQLADYRDALQDLQKGPMRCALYFTGLGLLHPLPELEVPQ